MRTEFFTAIAIAILFFVSALAKGFFPSDLPFQLDKIAIVLEVSTAVLLLFLYRRPWVWAALSTLFSLWLGYSFFWFLKNENCGCFGEVLPISSGVMAAVDAIAIGLSFWIWGKLEISPKKKMLFILIDGLVLLAGFLIAVGVNATN